jgi:hypothetical protein
MAGLIRAQASLPHRIWCRNPQRQTVTRPQKGRHFQWAVFGEMVTFVPTRPPKPSLDSGPIQRRVRRAFVGSGKSVLSTLEIARWAYPRGIAEHYRRQYVRRVCERYCVRVGRAGGRGRPILWRFKEGML